MYDFAVPIYVLNERRAVARLGISLEREWAGIRRMGSLVLGLGVLALAMGLGSPPGWRAPSPGRCMSLPKARRKSPPATWTG